MMLFAFVIEGGGPQQRNGVEVDEILILKIGDGDMEAFDKFYRVTERILYAYILSLARDHDITLDIMQDTYIKLISAAHLYKPMGKPLAWLFTIGKNIFYSRMRKSNKEIKLDAVEISTDKRFSYISEVEDRIVLEGVLELLTEEEREIVMLYAVSGMKHKEIAEHLDLKLSTALSKYHRAIKKLRDYLEGRGLKS